MNTINTIYSGPKGWAQLQEVILKYGKAGIYILADENTLELCLPLLKEKCSGLDDALVIEIHSGESNKTIGSIEKVWLNLVTGNAVRNSLMICLGGGVITDIGGFAAATFKRGMNFIHIPTTLLAMVDAALGGKTGVNLNSIKNQVGVFAPPQAVFVFTEFLDTLPARQKLSGFAEMLKHAMIDSESHFEKLIVLDSPEKACNEKDILESVSVKMGIVSKDSNEKGLRKVLNFGHTIGHAIETYSQKYDADPLLHGEAIAIGLICESFISVRLFNMADTNLKRLVTFVSRHFPHYKLKSGFTGELLSLMSHDKKNSSSSELNFSLINKIGEPVWDIYPGEKLILESLHFYMNLDESIFE